MALSNGGLTRDASINWLRYSSENDDMQSSFGNYEMAVWNGSTLFNDIIAESYRYPDEWPGDTSVQGTTDYGVVENSGGDDTDGWAKHQRVPNPLAGRGIVTHIFKQAPPGGQRGCG